MKNDLRDKLKYLSDLKQAYAEESQAKEKEAKFIQEHDEREDQEK